MMGRWIRASVAAMAILGASALGACASTPHYGREKTKALDKSILYVGSGTASYYAQSFKNRRTANGESYKPEEFTAAHPSLPFGTLLLVKQKATGRYVIVRINDRGPHLPGRVVDLSMAAARKLGFVQKGLAKVDLYVVPENSRLFSEL